MNRTRARSDSGAAAVEFALILPILVLLVVAIMEFGRIYNIQLGLTAAAREGVRTMAIENNPSAARAATKVAAPNLTPALTDGQIVIWVGLPGAQPPLVPPPGPAVCVVNQNATLKATYEVELLTGWFGDGIEITGRGVMRCNG